MLETDPKTLERERNLDRYWGPLRRYLPPKDGIMDTRFYLRFWLPFNFIVTLLVAVLFPILWMLHEEHIPHVVQFWSVYRAMFLWGGVYFVPWYLVSISAGNAYFAHVWNRRAERLQLQSYREASVYTPAGVWPPAPRL